MATLPFLTLPDPLVAGEGALDPLGLAMIGDRLAEEILPGLRARMSRPRFLTAIAVSAAVCEPFDGKLASDNVSPPYQVFEWLVVEAFVRVANREETRGTPGTQKAELCLKGDPLCYRTYLKTPSVFGFHGVYKALARRLGIVDEDFRLGDRGYELLKVWATEQGLSGFIDGVNAQGEGRAFKQMLRSAVEDGMAAACTRRSGGWQGWSLLAKHLVPAAIGRDEAVYLGKLLEDPDAEPRGEAFRLLRSVEGASKLAEDQIVEVFMLQKSGQELSKRLNAIISYERVCAAFEETFDWVRYMSTISRDMPIDAKRFAEESRTSTLAKDLSGRLAAAEDALGPLPLAVQQLFAQIAKGFSGVRDAATLFEAVLVRHDEVQKAKPPEGKRSWFERSPEGATYVRVPYRLSEQPEADMGWNRPYRLHAVASFLNDMREARGSA